MRKQPFTSKPLHHNILKEAQLVGTLDTLMTHVSHPQQLTALSNEDIQRIVGSNATATKQLRATLQLAHFLAVPQSRQLVTVRSPGDVVQYCRNSITFGNSRTTFLIGLNTKNMITTMECITEEMMQSLTTFQRAVFRHLIIHQCAFGILIQWHDAGEIDPPQEQINLVKQIVGAGEVIGISILDAIVMNDKDHFSFKENRCL